MELKETWQIYFQEAKLSKNGEWKGKHWLPNPTHGRSEGPALNIKFRQETNKTVMRSFNETKVTRLQRLSQIFSLQVQRLGSTTDSDRLARLEYSYSLQDQPLVCT